MSLEKDAIEILQTLTDAARKHWEGDGHEDYFECELVRAEEFLNNVGASNILWP